MSGRLKEDEVPLPVRDEGRLYRSAEMSEDEIDLL